MQMIVASSYKFSSNALYVSQKLRESGVNAIMKDEPDELLPFQVLVNENDLETVIPLITTLGIVESNLDPESEGYLTKHNEWNNQMYNPGHYTGGKTEYWLYNKATWKYIAPIYLLGGIGFLGILLYGNVSIDFETGLWIAVYIFVGGSMLWQLKNKKYKK